MVDASLQVDTLQAGATDDLADTVSYADVYKWVMSHWSHLQSFNYLVQRL